MDLCTFISPPLGYCVFTVSGLLGLSGITYIRMKREVTLGQVLSIAVTIIIAGLTGWITLTNKVERGEERDKNMEIRMTDFEIEIRKDRSDRKEEVQQTRVVLDQINGTVNDIRLDLKDKADRPK